MCHISCYVLAWTILGKLVAVMEVCVQGVPVGFVESLHMVVHGRCQISVGCYQMYLQNIKRSLSSVLAIYVNIHLLVFVKSVQHITILHIFYCAFLLKYFSVNHNFLSNLAQNGQIHGIKYWRILIFEFQLYKLSLRYFEKWNAKWNLNLANLAK